MGREQQTLLWRQSHPEAERQGSPTSPWHQLELFPFWSRVLHCPPRPSFNSLALGVPGAPSLHPALPWVSWKTTLPLCFADPPLALIPEGAKLEDN